MRIGAPATWCLTGTAPFHQESGYDQRRDPVTETPTPGRAAPSRFSKLLSLNPVLTHDALKGRTCQAAALRCSGDVAFGSFECTLDELSLKAIDSHLLALIVCDAFIGLMLAAPGVLREPEMVRFNTVRLAHDNGSMYGVLELAHVARPRMLMECIDCCPGQLWSPRTRREARLRR